MLCIECLVTLSILLTNVSTESPNTARELHKGIYVTCQVRCGKVMDGASTPLPVSTTEAHITDKSSIDIP